MEQVKKRVTQADLLRLEAEGKSVEVDDGEIIITDIDVDMNDAKTIEIEGGVTILHLVIIQHLFRTLDPFVTSRKLGTVYMDGVRYILAGTPQDIQRRYKPDFSFVRAGRIPKDLNWMGDFPFAPDLAVEVASPGQTNPTPTNRVSRYLNAGTEEVWLIYQSRNRCGSLVPTMKSQWWLGTSNRS
jgi:hypothetical protein